MDRHTQRCLELFERQETHFLREAENAARAHQLNPGAANYHELILARSIAKVYGLCAEALSDPHYFDHPFGKG